MLAINFNILSLIYECQAINKVAQVFTIIPSNEQSFFTSFLPAI